MDKFTYTLKLRELQTLTTKLAKKTFVSEAKVACSSYSNASTYYDIKLLLDILDTLPDTIIGVKSLNAVISVSIRKSDLTLNELQKLLHLVPKLPVTASNPFREFMYAPGIPAYMKIAVKIAQQTKES